MPSPDAAVGAIAIGWGAEAAAQTFAPGDVFVALRTGEMQWRRPDGMLNDGTFKGLAVKRVQ
jgi:hypothetical protein